MIKLSDYVIGYLESVGVSTVFTLTGGGIMHLVESVGQSKLRYVCCHHEQACSIAAQAYGLYAEELGVCLVTTGPGGTNALTGAAAAYVDSTPVLFITGQVKRDDFADLRGVRQYGAQEIDIISMARPVTKYAEIVREPESILYQLQKAVYTATHGRKGPVWLDIPLDVQAAMIDETRLTGFVPEENNAPDQVEAAAKQAYE
ncbi:MAG: thiamine pyrophosphate-binding protein, partial [Lachnospiraceae bacterium]|nr:thiamine pyrophosphate-binding protein [Lachnospiraceae bacterium]